MDGLSTAASALAVASVAIQVADSCMKLYEFWASIRDAPEEVAFIMEDLKYFSTVVAEIDRDKTYKAPSVEAGLRCCQHKIEELAIILTGFDAGFGSPSRKIRLWTALKATSRMKQLQKFRESLSEMKSTLMLALMYQSIRRSDMKDGGHNGTVFEDNPPPYQAIEARSTQYASNAPSLEDCQIGSSNKGLGQGGIVAVSSRGSSGVTSLLTNEIMKNILKRSVELAIDDLVDSKTLKELLSRGHGSVTSFESACSGDFGSDHCSFQKVPTTLPTSPPRRSNSQTAEQPSNSSRPSRSQVCHKVSSYGSAFGCIWIRTSTIHADTAPEGTTGSFETLTSFIFYPATWLKRIGVQQGVEASMVKSARGWQFHLDTVRAVPETSPIFQLCQTGEIKAVELLIANGHGSVFDTSPKGWTPLHFAAARGDVDLCRTLIRLGANKTALAYEGPAANVVSPIAIFATLAQDLPSETKIGMLRLFMECLDISDPNGDGWTVHAELKKAYSKEKVPVSQNSIMWLLRVTADEKFVTFGPKTIWSAVQSAVRSFLVHERNSGFLLRILSTSQYDNKDVSSSRATAFGHWLALRGSECKLLHMVLDAGRFCQIRGFDWVKDDITPSQYIKALPVIYATWSIALPDSLDKVEETIRSELDACLTKIGWTPTTFLQHLSGTFNGSETCNSEDVNTSRSCTDCKDHYGYEGYGLVQPARIKFTECCKTNHRMDCDCSNFLHDSDTTNTLLDSLEGDDSSVDEEFFDAEVDPDIYSAYLPAESRPDPFLDAATMLYRAQGRNLIGRYEANEELCATCFLRREEYIGENGLGTESSFTPMPASFETFRADVKDCTVDGVVG